MSSEAVETNTSAGKLWYLTITVLVLALDQLTKLWVARELYPDGEINIISGFLKFSYTENPGIAFGMLSDGNVKWLLVAVSGAAITIVIFYLMRTPASNSLLLWSLALLAAGISGNLIDRIRMGRVIDFIEVYYRSFHWPVFNVADTAISIGAALMAIELFFSSSPRKATSEELNEAPEKSPES
jgi:signal peptidase II